MSKTSIFAFFLLFSAAFVVHTAAAEIPVTACGKPPAAELNTDPGGTYCNIYTRQLEYADEDIKFQKLLKERQQNFVAPNIKATRQYREDVRSRHGFAPEKSGPEPSDSAETTEAFGPGLNP